MVFAFSDNNSKECKCYPKNSFKSSRPKDKLDEFQNDGNEIRNWFFSILLAPYLLD